MRKTDYHCHFEGSIPWRVFAKLFIKNRDYLLSSTSVDHFKFEFHIEAVDEIKKLLFSRASEITVTDYLYEKFVLRSPAKNLWDFIQGLPTSFIRWSCLDISDLRYLLDETIKSYNGFERVELFFCPFADENARYSWQDVCTMFSDTWSNLVPAKKDVFTFVLSLRKGQKDMEMDSIQEVISTSNRLFKKGIARFDISGDEDAFPYSVFENQLDYLIKKGKQELSLHIGETTSRDLEFVVNRFPEIKQFNHGVQIYKDEKLLEIAKERGIFFTICPESNWFTGALKLFVISEVLEVFGKKGINFGWGSDDRAIIGTV
ncbi:MAG TPA: hypothetical protein PK957_00430 [Candidatus Dojkabacteria bacterium]|nr:hypothetical protein [Candidatus Dojkabacteria bacterium]HQF36079.1 hypothetical protein [Candidatus Dojkabacteria bacterium]